MTLARGWIGHTERAGDEARRGVIMRSDRGLRQAGKLEL